MPPSIKTAAVLGAGVMGAQIAAHLANAGVPTLLLDIVAPDDRRSKDLTARNRIAAEGLARIKKIKPNPFFLPDVENLITVGNLEDDLTKLSEVDWIIEAVVENLEIKRSLLSKVASVIRPQTIVSSNTSGIRIQEMGRHQITQFKRQFVGTHFFNPPRYMKLLEIIPTSDTAPEVVAAIAEFGREALGKGIVYGKDAPGFIANRIGAFEVCHILHLMGEQKLSIEEIDLLTGPLTGKPKSATFRTLDLVGLDIFVHVADNLYENIPNDEMRSVFKVPDFVLKLVEKKWMGEKSGQGFYKRVRQENGESEIFVLDLHTFEYRPRRRVQLASVEAAKSSEKLSERMAILLAAEDRAGAFLRKNTAATLAYASNRIPEVCESTVDLDRAMRYGFLWTYGPFELWDALGVERLIPMMTQSGFQAAPWVSQMLSSGKTKFYSEVSAPNCPLASSLRAIEEQAFSTKTRHSEVIEPNPENGNSPHFHGRKVYAYDPSQSGYVPLAVDPKVIELAALKKDPARRMEENSGGSLIDLGDRVLCLEFHTKMNALGDDILKIANHGLDMLDEKYDAMVIGNQGENFSVGANLMLLLMLAQEEEWDEIERAVRTFQDFNMRMKYSPKPVVAAPHRRALGGGCELVMHAPLVCASAESYVGLVEMGAGLIPAGGGTKEMLCRALERGQGKKPAETIAAAFQTIGFARVSGSALEARKLGYFRDGARFVMNEDYLLHGAKSVGLVASQKGYKPMSAPKLLALGKSLHDTLAQNIHAMQSAGKISEYDAHLGKKLAFVMSGGNDDSSKEVTEQHFLDLERETFLSLCGEKKTQERMQHLLNTGKPLRN